MRNEGQPNRIPADRVRPGTPAGDRISPDRAPEQAAAQRAPLEARLRAAPYFILPDGSNRGAVRALGERFLDLTVEALSQAGSRPLLVPRTSVSGQARDRAAAASVPATVTGTRGSVGDLPGAGDAPGTGSVPPPALGDAASVLPPGYQPPREGRPAEALIEVIRTRVLTRVMNAAHPGYVGHMDTLPSAIGAFSDMLVSALNNNMLCWEMSPVFTEMEARLLEWVTRALGWAATSSTTPAPTGFLVSGGSLANLSAMLAARNVMCGSEFRERGLAAAPGPPVILASEEVHYSLDKIVNILGLGARGLERVATDGQLRLQPDALQEAITRVRARGGWPFAVVGIAGTTVTGAIDPLRAIGEIARRHGLWYHVDAAYGGSLLVSPAERESSARGLLDGIELADSVTFNPQKWLFVPKVCAGIFFRDSRRVAEAVRQSFPYASLGNGDIDHVRRNVGEYTIQGTRRVDVLKLWLTLEHFGVELLADLMIDSLERARRLAARIAGEPELELLSPPQLNIVCFRYRPPDLDPQRDGAALDRLNAEVHAALGVEGPGWIAIPRHRGRRWLRFVILHPLASDAVLREILEHVLAHGRRLAAQR